jgi:hypothetical protein
MFRNDIAYGFGGSYCIENMLCAARVLLSGRRQYEDCVVDKHRPSVRPSIFGIVPQEHHMTVLAPGQGSHTTLKGEAIVSVKYTPRSVSILFSC